MMPPNYLAVGLLIVGLVQTFSATDVKAQSKADQIRAIERQRLRALVNETPALCTCLGEYRYSSRDKAGKLQVSYNWL